jgi:hypothetical protein
MPDEVKKPAPGSFSKLMSPTPPAKPQTKDVEEKPGKHVPSRAHAPERTEKERTGITGDKNEEFKQETTKEKLQESKQEVKKERGISSNIAILQAGDIKALKNPVFRNQTLRFSDEELDWCH